VCIQEYYKPLQEHVSEVTEMKTGLKKLLYFVNLIDVICKRYKSGWGKNDIFQFGKD
jgi:hypothetical protein